MGCIMANKWRSCTIHGGVGNRSEGYVRVRDRYHFDWNSRTSSSDKRLCAGWIETYAGGIERGERNVALVNIEKIAKALRLSIGELLRGL